MAACDPIELPEERKAFLNAMKGSCAIRNKAFVATGFATGLRVTEIICLRIGDVLNENGSFKQTVTITTQMYEKVAERKKKDPNTKSRKTKKHARSVFVNPACYTYLKDCISELHSRGYRQKEDYLFITSTGKLVSRWHMYRIMKRAAQKCNIDGTIGTHTMRKTFSLLLFNQLKDDELNGEKIDLIFSMMLGLGQSNYNSVTSYLKFINHNLKRKITNLDIGI